jgi:hypothetical protein
VTTPPPTGEPQLNLQQARQVTREATGPINDPDGAASWGQVGVSHAGADREDVILARHEGPQTRYPLIGVIPAALCARRPLTLPGGRESVGRAVVAVF